MLRSATLAFLSFTFAFGATGCDPVEMDGQLDRPLLLKKGSGQVSRFEAGPVTISLQPERSGGTRITLSQPGVRETTRIALDLERFDNDLFSFDERETGTGFAVRGERRRTTVKRPLYERRKCRCQAEFRVQDYLPSPDGGRAWYTQKTYQRSLEGTYTARDDDAQYLNTHYQIEILSRGSVVTRFDGTQSSLQTPLKRIRGCSIDQPSTKITTESEFLSSWTRKDGFSQVLENTCVYE